MNHISKIHQEFSRRLNNPRVLENPGEFLGENFEAVLNFWLFLDDLSEEQIKVVEERYKAFYNENYSEWLKAIDLAINTSAEVVGEDYADETSRAVGEVTNSWVACMATLELIAMHKILEDPQQPLTFFQMILEVYVTNSYHSKYNFFKT